MPEFIWTLRVGRGHVQVSAIVFYSFFFLRVSKETRLFPTESSKEITAARARDAFIVSIIVSEAHTIA